MSNVSLDETLFYQYMINNNSTSTMLNAISGNNNDNSNSLLSALGGLQNMNALGTGSISDVATLLGLGSDTYGGIGSVNSFSSVLQTYLNAERQGAAQMTEKIEKVMDEVADTPETESRSYQTLEEIYQYFQEQSSSKASALLSGLTGTTEKTSTDSRQETASDVAAAGFDFDAFETETDEMIDSMIDEVGVNVGI